jgi:hypothetical protein
MVAGAVCPTDGRILVASPGSQSAILYRSDGTVDIHAGNVGQSFPLCRDPAFFVCSI